MASQKRVVLLKTSVQSLINYLKTLDSGFRRTGGMLQFMTFARSVILRRVVSGDHHLLR
jgi:hypothetical protein